LAKHSFACTSERPTSKASFRELSGAVSQRLRSTSSPFLHTRNSRSAAIHSFSFSQRRKNASCATSCPCSKMN
jgi:hypothetical protein